MNIEDKSKPLIDQLPPETWLNVLKFLDEQDVENLIFAYPEFRLLKIAWNVQENKSFKTDPSKEKFIPIIQTHYGSRTLFRFSDVEFFSQHIHQCCRVAAVYAFFLLGNAQDSTTYTVRYNRYTHEVCEVEIEKLLADVFYNRNCYGSLYRVEQQDEKKRQPEIDLDYSVDRTYMTNRHQSQFIGQDLLPRFHFKVTSIPVSDEEEEDSEMDDDYLPEKVDESYIRACQRRAALNDYQTRFIDMRSDDDDDESFKKDDLLGYREQLMKQTDRNFGTSICRMVSAENHIINNNNICHCGMDMNYVIEDVTDLIRVYNHLIFDFDTHQLKVERLSDEDESKHPDPIGLLDHHTRTLKSSVSKNDSISYYRVNIEKLAEKTKGFSHASCYCEYPAVETNQFSFLDYTYLSHVQLTVVQNTDHVFVLATYDGIVAL